jgi:hypothetical protein
MYERHLPSSLRRDVAAGAQFLGNILANQQDQRALARVNEQLEREAARGNQGRTTSATTGRLAQQ